MITNLHIKNFKSHKDTELFLRPLTILTGINGSGKSSVIQSLLLLRQSYKKQRLNEALILNDTLCSIGIGKDAVYQSAEDAFIQFALSADGFSCSWKFAENEQKDFLPVLEKQPVDFADHGNVSLFNNDFHYLSAGRLPEFKFSRADIEVENDRQISLKNGYGELVAQYLFYYGAKDVVRAELRNSNSKFGELIHQVTAWEREISPNVNVVPEKTGESFTVNYSFDTQGSTGPTEKFKAENAAFGLTYALPVITALLSARQNALLLIENPEAHLHPQGQSKLAELIALAAQTGVQIIIETHSDHIVNGILVSCKKYESGENGIDRNKIKLFYFGEKDEKNASTFTDIAILEGGKIDKQPEGFFDQLQHDLGFIMGF